MSLRSSSPGTRSWARGEGFTPRGCLDFPGVGDKGGRVQSLLSCGLEALTPPTSCPVGSNTAVKHSGLLFFGGVSFGLQGWVFFFFFFHFNEPSIWKISSQSHATNTKLEPSVQIKQLGAFVPLRAEMYGSFRLRGPTLSLNSFFFP